MDPEQRLGVDAIKSHPFFTEDPTIDFAAIWTIDPPQIQTGLTEPRIEQKGEFVLIGEFDGEHEEGEDDLENEDGDDEREQVASSRLSQNHRQGNTNGFISRTEPVTKW